MIVYYDEHGGFYDHVSPNPITYTTSSPDNLSSFGMQFLAFEFPEPGTLKLETSRRWGVSWQKDAFLLWSNAVKPADFAWSFVPPRFSLFPRRLTPRVIIRRMWFIQKTAAGAICAECTAQTSPSTARAKKVANES